MKHKFLTNLVIVTVLTFTYCSTTYAEAALPESQNIFQASNSAPQYLSTQSERDWGIFRGLGYLFNLPSPPSSQPPWGHIFQSMRTIDRSSPSEGRFRIGGVWVSQTPNKLYMFIYEEARTASDPEFGAKIKSIDVDIDGKVQSFTGTVEIEGDGPLFVAAIPMKEIRAMNKAKHCFITVNSIDQTHHLDYSAPKDAQGKETAIIAVKNFLIRVDTSIKKSRSTPHQEFVSDEDLKSIY